MNQGRPHQTPTRQHPDRGSRSWGDRRPLFELPGQWYVGTQPLSGPRPHVTSGKACGFSEPRFPGRTASGLPGGGQEVRGSGASLCVFLQEDWEQGGISAQCLQESRLKPVPCPVYVLLLSSRRQLGHQHLRRARTPGDRRSSVLRRKAGLSRRGVPAADHTAPRPRHPPAGFPSSKRLRARVLPCKLRAVPT